MKRAAATTVPPVSTALPIELGHARGLWLDTEDALRERARLVKAP